MANEILIGNRLTTGLILNDPMNPENTVTIEGTNKSRIIGATFQVTRVPVEFWENWKAYHGTGKHIFPAYASGTIFEAGSTETEAEKEAKNLEGTKTGLEGLDPEKPGHDLTPLSHEEA